MRSLILITAASLSFMTPAFAQPVPQRGNCTQQHPCPRAHGKVQHAPVSKPRAHVQQRRHHQGPRVGERFTRGHALPAAKLRFLPKPPRGQSYRVVDDHIVRVDDNTLQILALAGLLSALN